MATNDPVAFRGPLLETAEGGLAYRNSSGVVMPLGGSDPRINGLFNGTQGFVNVARTANLSGVSADAFFSQTGWGVPEFAADNLQVTPSGFDAFTLTGLFDAILIGYVPVGYSGASNYGNNAFNEFFHANAYNLDVSFPQDGSASFAQGNFQVTSSGSIKFLDGNQFPIVVGANSLDAPTILISQGGSVTIQGDFTAQNSIYTSGPFACDNGNIYSDGGGRITTGAFTSDNGSIGSNGNGVLYFNSPGGLCLTSTGGYQFLVYVDDGGNLSTQLNG